jgi:hypothetical protein
MTRENSFTRVGTWTTAIQLELAHQDLRTLTEVLTYDWFSFMADVGGYVGLLLGYSFLSLFEDYVDKLYKHMAMGQKKLKKKGLPAVLTPIQTPIMASPSRSLGSVLLKSAKRSVISGGSSVTFLTVEDLEDTKRSTISMRSLRSRTNFSSQFANDKKRRY